MRINEYEKLEDFYNEYAYGSQFSWENKEHIRRYIGIEFKHSDEYYRMCNEPLKEEDYPTLPDGTKLHYDVMQIKDYWSSKPEFITIGWYRDLDDVLENCCIQGKKFREVIMDDNTEILAKD